MPVKLSQASSRLKRHSYNRLNGQCPRFYTPHPLAYAHRPGGVKPPMYTDRLLIIFILGTYLLSPAIIDWWSEGGRAWYRPYLIWLGLIALSYWIAKSKDVDGL